MQIHGHIGYGIRPSERRRRLALHNPNFKPLELDGFRKEAGLNAFTMSPTKWMMVVNAMCIVIKAGR